MTHTKRYSARGLRPRFRAVWLVAGATLILSACGDDSDTEAVDLELGTMDGTTHFDRASSWSSIVNSETDGVTFTPSNTGGTLEMLRRVDAGELDVGVTTTSDYAAAVEAGEVDPENVRALWGHDQGLWHVVVWADSSFQDVYDLEDAKISVGPPGSLIAGLNEILWSDIVGIDYEPVSVSLPDAAEQMKDGVVDAFTVGALPPQPVVADLAATNEIRLLPLPEDVAGELADRVGGRLGTITTDMAYNNQANAEDVPTIGLASMYIVPASMDDDVAYEITSALFENIDTFHAASETNTGITAENATDFVVGELHPGAQRYFEEVGSP